MARLAGRNKRNLKTFRTTTQAVAAANATAAAGATPTKAEFDAVVTLVNELKTDVNSLVTALRG
jgi:hypothetical protein